MKKYSSKCSFKHSRKENHYQSSPIKNTKIPLPIINKIYFNAEECTPMNTQIKNIELSRYSKRANFSTQEIQLNNSKWLIFNDDKQEEKRNYTDFTSIKRNTSSKVKRNQKISQRCNRSQKSMEIVNLEEKGQKQNKIQYNTSGFCQESCLKSPKKTEIFKNSRKLNVTIKDQVSKEKNSLQNSKYLSCSRSNKSCKSMKSSESIKTLKSNKSKTQLITKRSVKQESYQNNEPQINHEIVEQKSKEKDSKFITITRLYNEIELLYPNVLNKQNCNDLFYDFSEWISTSPVLVETPSLVIQQKAVQPILANEVPQIQRQQPQICTKEFTDSYLKQLMEDIINKLEAQVEIPLFSPSQILQQKINGDLMIPNQCLTTKETQLQHHDQSQYSNAQIQQISPSFPHKQRQTKQQSMKRISFIDQSFDILAQFTSFKEVRVIKIDSNAQTALFPCKSIIQYIRPIPSTSNLHNQYKNDEILSFLNHILFTQSTTLENAFEKPSKQGFRCNFYENQQQKSVTVDGLLPFDANYYPLYGDVDQFIWFSVFIKCIAKLRGSYKALNDLRFRDIYELLTGRALLQLKLDYNENHALRDFKLIYKNSQSNQTVFLVKKDNKFYKLIKIQSIKVVSKSRLNQFRPNPMKTSTENQDNYKSLTQFLKKEKKIYEQNKIYENTLLFLKGYNEKRKITFKDFIDEQFQAYVSENCKESMTQKRQQIEFRTTQS